MKAKLYLAKAGSGKSYFATRSNKILNGKYVLFVTYTNQNTQVLLKYLRKSPVNYKKKEVKNWFEFLLDNFIRPYKRQYLEYLNIDNFSGISWDRNCWNGSLKNCWTDNHNHLFGYKCSSIILSNQSLLSRACDRLCRFYDYIVIDEFQDITGVDADLLKILLFHVKNTSLKFLLFGDLYQANVQTTDVKPLLKNIMEIKDDKRFVRNKYGDGIEIDTTTLIKSRRIGAGVANFINKILKLKIETSKDNNSTVLPNDLTTIPTNKEGITNIFSKVEKILVYNKTSLRKEYIKFKGKTVNWGYSKGETYDGPIAVVLTKEIYKKLNRHQDLSNISVGTFTKFYVALTRSRSNVYLVFLAKNK